ncbi:MAG: hypothetical protein ACRDDH_11730 [Cetobacterium sp.]|uniref:hypothetical protein n=1 Tax=Cetobacterium sp. TaxID=2071632 RepID=UPI003EE612CE
MRAYNRKRGPKHRTKGAYRVSYRWDYDKCEWNEVKVLQHCRPTRRISLSETDFHPTFSLKYTKVKCNGNVWDMK